MPARVLVVTDSQSSGRVLEARLSADSYAVDMVQGGWAMSPPSPAAPDLVLVDAVAAGSEAWQGGLGLRRCWPGQGVPTLVVCRADGPAARLAALEAGADDVMTRPAASRDVLSRVQALVRCKTVLDELRIRANSARALAGAHPVTMAPVEGPAAVLLIDDDEAAAGPLRELLADACIDARRAGQAADGFDLAGGAAADLVLLGLDLACEDPLHVLSRLRASPATRPVPVLLLAGPRSAGRLARCYDLGASDSIQRPLHPPELLARVHRHVARRRAAHALRLDRSQAVATGVRDPITGLFTQVFLSRHLQAHLRSAAAATTAGAERELGLLLVDIDYLATINERFGQAAGDAALAAVGGVLRRCVRGIDSVARHGAASLAVLIPGAGPAETHAVAGRLRLAVEAMVFEPLPGECAGLTVSIGAVARCRRAIGAEPLLDEADRALRLAKREGRNRVWSAPVAISPQLGMQRA